MLGIGATLVGGLLLGFSNQNYGMYQELERLIAKDTHVCTADICDTSYLSVPGRYLQESLKLLYSGLVVASFGLSLLVMKRHDLIDS